MKGTYSPGGTNQSERRKGTILIIAMVVLLVFMMISSMLIHSVIQSRTQMIREEQLLQAIQLADAGIHRGMARFQSDQSFRKETWQVPAETTAGLDPATVTIVVADILKGEKQRICAVVAEYPSGSPNPIRVTREALIPSR